MTVRIARRLLLAAGIYGVLVVTPVFFLEERLGEESPPPVTHAEYYYGFACVTLAWQIVYLLMSRDPLRLLPILPPAAAGKAGFAFTVFILAAQQRLAGAIVWLAAIDLLLAGLLVWVFFALRNHPGTVGWIAAGSAFEIENRKRVL